jgi:F0F1-type ATP synthase assembly protein I
LEHPTVERVADQEQKGRGPDSGNADYDRLLHRRKGVSGSQFAGIGIQFAVSIVLFAFAGVWLDKRLGTSPMFVLLLVLGGGALAFWTMVRKLK